MQTVMLISADEQGRLTFIYSDELAELFGLGKSETKRASHVEPAGDNQWTADMAPVGGPVLGPFNCRQDALDAEHVWIETNVL